MAEDLTSAELAVPVPAPAPAAPAPASTSRHRPRFIVVYGVLGAVLGLAVALVVVYAGRAITPTPTWSTWKPTGGGLGAGQQIANEVSKSYRLANGNQLVEVLAKAPSVTETGPKGGTIPVPLRGYAIQSKQGDDIFAVSAANSMMYELCGLGPACTIASGTPSAARGTLVRREILELALYTFKYVPGINSIVAFMPPADAGAKTPHYTVVLKKSNLETELHTPLAKTLGAKTPQPSTIPEREIRVVNDTTGSQIYTFGVLQTQTGAVVGVFKPGPAA